MPVPRLKKGRGWVGRREEEFFCNCQLEYKYSDTLSLPVPMYCPLQTAQELGVLFFYFYIHFFPSANSHTRVLSLGKKYARLTLTFTFKILSPLRGFRRSLGWQIKFALSGSTGGCPAVFWRGCVPAGDLEIVAPGAKNKQAHF